MDRLPAAGPRCLLTRASSQGKDVGGPLRNFQRIVRYAFRYRWTLAGILLSSALAAALWGANLGTIYPIVDIVLQRQSMRGWVDQRLATAEKKSEELRKALAEKPGLPAADRSGERRRLEASLRAEQRVAERSRRLQPWIHRYFPADPFATLQWVVLALLLGTVIKSLFLVLNVVLVERITQRVIFDLRNQLYARALSLDMAFFSREREPRLLSLFTHDVEAVLVGVRTVFGRAIVEPLKIMACLVGAAWFCWRLLVLSLLVTPLAILLIDRLSRMVKRASHHAMDDMAGLYNRFSESMQGIQIVKAYRAERHERRRFREQGRELVRRNQRIAWFTALTKPGNELMGMAVIGCALLAGGYLVLNESTHLLGIRLSARPLEFGELMAFFALLAGVSDPFRKLIDVYNQLQHAAAAADRVWAFKHQRPTVIDPPRPVRIPPGRPRLDLQGVSFGYAQGPRVLHDVSLAIEPGQTVALVGTNGCGKSTLLSLLMRLYDPLAGSLHWNGCDLRHLRLMDLRQRIGLVTQQAILFDESVADNIRYGNPQATDADVMAAARRAHAHEFIVTQLAEGYATRVGSGGKLLSGGQRQRISLARAILRDPELLLLDEATSQVDVESERLIHESLRDFVANRTTILVAHRPETMTLAERIVVLDAGRIIDDGRHHELLPRCPFYSRLQFADLRATG